MSTPSRPRAFYEPDRGPGLIPEWLAGSLPAGPLFGTAEPADNARHAAQGRMPGVILPLALEAVPRIDALFEIENWINGLSAERRRTIRPEVSAPLVADLERPARCSRVQPFEAATIERRSVRTPTHRGLPSATAPSARRPIRTASSQR